MACGAILRFFFLLIEVMCEKEDSDFYLDLSPRRPPPPGPHRPPGPPPSQTPPSTTFLPLSSTSATSINEITGIATEFEINRDKSRCKFGRDSATNFSSSETKAERLYIDTYNRAQCGGFIHWWSICLWSKSEINIGSVTLIFIQTDTNGVYSITGQLASEVLIGRRRYDDPICVQFNNEQKLEVKEGTQLGILLHGSIYMALAILTPGQVNPNNATLSVSRSQILSSSIRNASHSVNLQINGENLEDFAANNLSVVPLVQVILDNESPYEPTSPIEHYFAASNNVLKSAEFLTLLGSAAAITVVLSITLLAMACCLWRLNSCLEMCPCCFQKRRQDRTVTHVVQVEPAFEQSMLYNQMYTSGSHIQRRSSHVMPNPAYNLDQSRPLRIGVRDDLSSSDNILEMTQLPCEDGFNDTTQEAASSYDHPTSRLFNKDTENSDLEHTYEVVNIR